MLDILGASSNAGQSDHGAPLYEQGPSPGPSGIGVADSSVEAAFEDYLAHTASGYSTSRDGTARGARTDGLGTR